MELPSFPYKILILAPFLSERESSLPEGPLQVNLENPEDIFSQLNPSFYVPLPKELHPTGGVDINPKKNKDFHPDSLVQTLPFLKTLWEAREFLKEARAKGISEEDVAAKLANWPELPSEFKYTPSTFPKKKEKDKASKIDDLLKMVALPEEEKNLSGAYIDVLSSLEWQLQQILKAIFKDQTFRKAEATWLGFKYLCNSMKGNHKWGLNIYPISEKNLQENLDHLLPLLITDLPSLIILDCPLDNSNVSIENLQKVASLAETLLVPVVGWIKPQFFYLESWAEITKLPFLPHFLEESAYAKWRQLKKTPAARWLAITCNCCLGRYPYGAENKPKQVYFEESQELWLSPVWAMGIIINQSIQKYGWPTRITDWKKIFMENLPLPLREGNKTYPTEVLFSEDRIDQFIRAGIIPLVSMANKDMAFFPRETTIAGGSFAYQLLLTRITQFILWLKENYGQEIPHSHLEPKLKETLSLFFAKIGDLSFQRMEISVAQPIPGKPAAVKIEIEPSPRLLPSGEKIELKLDW
ncbi:MAG: type VI secretion system contractile sheath domain-containing protein [bacterium]